MADRLPEELDTSEIEPDFYDGYPDREDLLTLLADDQIAKVGLDFFNEWGRVKANLRLQYQGYSYSQLVDVCIQRGLLND